MISFLVGSAVGAVATVVATIVVMRSRMIQVVASPLGFDETLAALDRGVQAAEGWSSPGKRDLNAMLRKHGVDLAPRVTLVEVCKAPYAKAVLQDDRRMATLMPCALAVYEDDDGRVWISKMNTGLMGGVFGGTVGRIMGGLVSGEESTILAEIEAGARLGAASPPHPHQGRADQQPHREVDALDLGELHPRERQ